MQPFYVSAEGVSPFSDSEELLRFFAVYTAEKRFFFGGFMAKEKLTRSDCLALLKEKYSVLSEKGENRYPKRSDFTEREVVAVKAFLGPWPRALEAAGIKPPRPEKNKKRSQRDNSDKSSETG